MEALSRREMELIQLIGYNWAFLRNGKFKDWAEFLWRYRTAGISLVKNMVSRRRRRRETDEVKHLFFENLLEVREPDAPRTGPASSGPRYTHPPR